MASYSELDLIKQLATTQVNTSKNLVCGIGDDAAIVNFPAKNYCISTDTLISGVHFPAAINAADLGWRSLAVNLSDLAAMAAEPEFVLLNLALPTSDSKWLEQFMQGFQELQQQFPKLSLIGGDTCKSNLLTLTCTVIGAAANPIKRSTAKVGDAIFVTGSLGNGKRGLELFSATRSWADKTKAEQLFLRPQPRVTLAQQLATRINSMIDISDGLAGDLQHILTASNCGAQLELEKLPLAIDLAALPLQQQWSYALYGGDEYQLLFTAASDNTAAILANENITQIGTIIAEPGLELFYQGEKQLLSGSSYDHFAC